MSPKDRVVGPLPNRLKWFVHRAYYLLTNWDDAQSTGLYYPITWGTISYAITKKPYEPIGIMKRRSSVLNVAPFSL